MTLMAFVLAMLSIAGCNDEGDDAIPGENEEIEDNSVPPTVVTSEVIEILGTSAICGGEVTEDGGAEVTARGVCWSTDEYPTISDSRTFDENGIGSFTSKITGLKENIRYYVRAYATNEAGTSYGEVKEFITMLGGEYNGYEYVDLGLPSGLKWATCNIGADSPEEYGNYYAWGETRIKESYTEQNCTTWEKQIGDISGNSQYDAARANWGGTWKTPDKSAFDELKKKCEWEWTTQNGVNGYKVIGPNGNYIFFPAAGYRSNTWLLKAGEEGNYWSSQGSFDYNTWDGYVLSWCLHFGFDFNSNAHVYHIWDLFRDDGYPVRPVSY